MAGERKGKTYEALVLLALRCLKEQKGIHEEIFWNKKPELMTIEPDLTIGPDVDNPHTLLLVTHSSSTKDSEKKFWRNIGELAEAKTLLPTRARVYNIMFDSRIKEDLKTIQGAAFDGQLIIGDKSYGQSIQRWVDRNIHRLPQDGEQKVSTLRDFVNNGEHASDLRRLVQLFIADLDALLSSSSPKLDSLWTMARDRGPGKRPVARKTFARRGLTKAALMGEVPIVARGKVVKNAPRWMEQLGLLTPSIGGARLTDPELLWLATSELGDIDLSHILRVASTTGFRQQLAKVGSIALVAEFAGYVTRHLSSMQSTEGMLKHLRIQRENPADGINVPPTIEPPQNVWLFDYVGALTKARTGKSQGFGYSHLATHPQANRSRVGNMELGVWCSCFMNQYFSRKSDFHPPLEAERFVAEVLAEQLKGLEREEIARATTRTLQAYVAKEYEATLLTHRGFNPIGGILELRAGIPLSAQMRVRGAFAERGLSGGASGSTSVTKVRQTFIKWQSVTDAGRDHKKKELCGRAVALRFLWDSTSQQFVPRPGIRKLILVVDGTWREDDLRSLAHAGWDEIFYPDETERIAQAIL